MGPSYLRKNPLSLFLKCQVYRIRGARGGGVLFNVYFEETGFIEEYTHVYVAFVYDSCLPQ